jgi:hypothetical protein
MLQGFIGFWVHDPGLLPQYNNWYKLAPKSFFFKLTSRRS